MEAEEVHGVLDEEVVLPLLVHEGGVGPSIVQFGLLDGGFESLFGLVQPNYLPLLFLHERDGLEDRQGCAIVMHFVVVVQPQIVHRQQH